MSELTRSQRISDAVTEFCGSWTFIILFAIFTCIWILMNIVIVSTFDRYPFILLNLVFTVIELFQGPLILMSQNRALDRDREKLEQDREYAKEMRSDLNQIKELLKAREI